MVTSTVKVIYTSDDQSERCLTRLPNAVSVPVVALDENTQVGVIELKTCIQALVASRCVAPVYNLCPLLLLTIAVPS
jgi:hypothetical protein